MDKRVIEPHINHKYAHIFRYDVSYLTKTIVPTILKSGGRSDTIFLNVTSRNKLSFFENENKKWMAEVPNTLDCNFIDGALWTRMPIRKFRVLKYPYGIISCIFSDISLKGLWKLWLGPKNVIIHGFIENFLTLMALRAMGKRLVYIHWGGNIFRNGRFWKFRLWGISFFVSKVFVLMKPEVEYFKRIMAPSKIAVMPYWKGQPFVLRQRDQTDKKSIVFGNNRYGMKGWRRILSEIKVGEFDEIICMLNYGGENNEEEMRMFIEEWGQKFGRAFKPWKSLVSLDEYYATMKQSQFYVCPMPEQSGLGAIYTSIEYGKAIFLRGDNYKWLQEMGIRVGNLDDMSDFSYKTMSAFIPSKKEHDANVLKLNAYFRQCGADESWYNNLTKDLHH